MRRSEIEKAIQRSFDGTLSGTECVELREILKSDPEVRALYYEYVGLHQALEYRLSRFTAHDTGRALAEALLRQQKRRSVRFSILAAAAGLICLGVALRLVFVPDPPPLAMVEVASGTIFNVEHADPDGEVAEGELGKGSTVYLTQGSLEIESRHGSRAVLLAPSIIHLQSDKKIFLHRGTAWFQISKEDHGFEVRTPEMVVVDLGTEFGVLSDPGVGDELHVFSGKVRTRSLNALRKVAVLTTGQARSCDPVGKLAPIPLRPEGFLTGLPDDPRSGVLSNGDFETGATPANHRYGIEATPALLPSWQFGSMVRVGRAESGGRLGYGDEAVTVLSSTGDTQIAFGSDVAERPDPENVSVWQTFPTEAGQRYEVTFEMGALIYNIHALEVTATVHDGMGEGAQLGERTESRSAGEGSGYNAPVRFEFQARSRSATLRFTETSQNTQSADPVIDNVSVREIN